MTNWELERKAVLKKMEVLMDAVKDEPNLDPMALENDRNEEGERPMPMEGNFLKVDIEIKEEPSELVDDLTLDIKYEENISPTTIPLMKFETEKDPCNMAAMQEDLMTDITKADVDLIDR
ncbi:uncharacterized protein [Periplaneta americana]